MLLWTWERIGLGTLERSINVIVERAVHCSDAATLGAVFQRLFAVAMQIEGGWRHVGAPTAGARGETEAEAPPAPAERRGRLVV